MTTFPAIHDLIPHRGTMLFVDSVTAFEDERITAEYTPKAGAWYANAAGQMPAWLGIEVMAQTVAAHNGMLRWTQQQHKQGVLLGARRMPSSVSKFQAGVALQITATPVYRDDTGLGAYDCSISCAGTLLVEATLKVYEPDDFQSFLQAS